MSFSILIPVVELLLMIVQLCHTGDSSNQNCSRIDGL